MKKLFLFITTLCVCAIATAQTLSPTVLASSGGYFTSVSGSLSVTVGEMTMVQTFSSASNILTQGFQQPEDITVSITENIPASGEILIFPNPTNGMFALSYSCNTGKENIISLYNLVGQLVLRKAVSQSAGTNTVIIDISSFSQGVYLLELTTENSKGETNTIYCKVDLVY